MAVILSFTKQPREKDAFEIDYTGFINGRTVDSISATVTLLPVGMSSAGHQFFGNIIQVKYESGVDGIGYRFVVLTVITIGGYPYTVEDEIDIAVIEVPNSL